MIKRFLQAESPTLFIFISSSPTSKVKNTINLFAKPIRPIKSTSIQTNWWPTISSKTITVWTFHWRSYSPIRIWGQPSREIYFGIIRKFTSNCLKRKDSGNVTGKKSRTIFGDSFNWKFKNSGDKQSYKSSELLPNILPNILRKSNMLEQAATASNESYEIGSKLVYSKWNVQSLTRVLVSSRMRICWTKGNIFKKWEYPRFNHIYFKRPRNILS